MLSRPNLDINRDVIGYVLNAALSSSLKKQVESLQGQLAKYHPEVLWLTPPDSLHITLMDWVAPLVNYETDKDELFGTIFPKYDEGLAELLIHQPSIPIHFEALGVSPDAIFIKGVDDGSFQRIRDSFVSRFKLPTNTKAPSTIIHFTIARYKRAVPLANLEKTLNKIRIDLYQDINSFRLVREKVAPMLKYEVIKEYHLSG